jgi:predicted type IV restriction endonuclease
VANNEVTVSEDGSTSVSGKKPAVTRTGPKWEADVRERLKLALRKYSKPLADLVARDANEGDTRLFVTDFLCDALGYDKYADLTTEYQVKGEFADYGVRIDKQLIAFIEVKRATTKLDVKHLRQVEMYAVNEGVEWVFLTNGEQWKVYHITGGLPVSIDIASDIHLLGEESPQHRVNQLFYLTRESLKRREIDALWMAKRATSPKALAKVVMSEAVLNAIQKELRKQTGHKAEEAEINKLLRNTVLRPECFDKA